jgi:hypothetical protein
LIGRRAVTVVPSDSADAAWEAPVFTRPRRYLVRMGVFLGVVALVAAILGPGLYGAFMANPLLNGVIVGVLLVGIAYSFRSVLGLVPEIDWLERFRAERAGRPVEGPAPQPRLLAPMARMLGERQGRLGFSAMAMRSLLDGIEARMNEGREISRYLVGLLIFLGLLGTFWGLLQTIGAVGGVIAGLSVETDDIALIFSDLKQGLEAPLSGMGTAFSSSLFGLAGSLVLGFLELQAGQAQGRFFNQLEDWLSGAAKLTGGGPLSDAGETSVPAYMQALMEHTAENLDALQRVVAQGEDSRRQASQNLSALVDRLSTLTDQMRAEQALMVKLAESQMELKPILARLTEAANQGAFGLDSQSREHVRSIDVHLRRLSDEMTTNRDLTVSEIRGEIKLLARTIAALAEETG